MGGGERRLKKEGKTEEENGIGKWQMHTKCILGPCPEQILLMDHHSVLSHYVRIHFQNPLMGPRWLPQLSGLAQDKVCSPP